MRSLVLLEDQANIGRTRKQRPLAQDRPVEDVAFVRFAIGKGITQVILQVDLSPTGPYRPEVSIAAGRWRAMVAEAPSTRVINYSEEGFAQVHYIAHSSGVSAISLKQSMMSSAL